MIWDWQILPTKINGKITKLKTAIFQSELAIIFNPSPALFPQI